MHNHNTSLFILRVLYNLKKNTLLYNQKYDYIVVHMIGLHYTHFCVFMYNHIMSFSFIVIENKNDVII